MAIKWLRIRIRMLRATLSYVMTALFLNRDNHNMQARNINKPVYLLQFNTHQEQLQN